METRQLFHGYSIREDGEVYRPNGDVVPTNKFNDYRGVVVSGRNYYVHRLVARKFVDQLVPWFKIVDHIDRDKFNNHKSNLRWVSKRINSLNSDAKNAYKVRNAWKRRNPWMARVCGKVLGYFNTYEEAHAVGKAYRFSLIDLLIKEACESYKKGLLTCSSETSDRYPVYAY